MIKITNEIVFIFLAIVFIWWLMRHKRIDNFDPTGTEFVPVGFERYGLRGEPIAGRDIAYNYIRPDRHMVLNNTSGLMWESDMAPEDEGIPKCKQVPCPTHRDGYDDMDKCWTCDRKPRPDIIPNIHPHVKN